MTKPTSQVLRTGAMAAVALLLMVLLYLDQGSAPKSPDGDGEAPAADEERRLRLLRIVQAEKEINRAYGRSALVYAQRMADLATFRAERGGNPQTILEQWIREQLVAGPALRLDSIQTEAPRALAEGVFRLNAEVKWRAYTHQAALEGLRALGRPAAGLVWERFTLDADEGKRFVDVEGRLVAVIVESFE